MIIDCFTFAHEIDLLKLRTNYLNDVVDFFVIAEANESHSGVSKKLELKEIMEKRELNIPYEKIIAISIIDLPPIVDGDCWPRETDTRKRIKNKLMEMDLSDDTIIMYSDIDEFPKKEFVGKIGLFQMEPVVYWLNVYMPKTMWQGTVALKFGDLKNTEIQTIRDRRHSYPDVADNAGWHFTYQGGGEFIKNKILYSAHKEQDKIDGTFLKWHLDKMKNFDGLAVMPLNKDLLPDYLIDNIREYKHMIRGRKVFIDCGSHKGESYNKFQKEFSDNGKREYYAFEPNILTNTLLPNLIQKAVWVRNGYVNLYPGAYNEETCGYTIMKDISVNEAKIDKSDKGVLVESIDFSLWLQRNFKLEDHIILKFDIEGAEFSVLMKMIVDETIDLIDELYIEWHDSQYDLHDDMFQIVKILNEKKIKHDSWDALV